jgi:hypothetical protein
MSDAIKAALDAAARSVCQERCAFMGEPPCWSVTGDDGESMGWPNVECDEPGCSAITPAAIAAFLTQMAGSGVSLAHQHEWHDLAKRVQEAAKNE